MRRSELRKIIQEEVKKASRKSHLQESTPDTRVRSSYGVVTGRPVPRADIESDISDMAKELDGRRWPRTQNMSDEDLHALHDELLQRLLDRDREGADLDGMYPEPDIDPLYDDEPEPFEDLPKHSGMGRALESKIQIKTGDLRKIIQEEISKSVDLDDDIEAKKEEVEALEKLRDLHDEHPKLKGALQQESTRGAAQRAAIASELEHDLLTQYDSYSDAERYRLGWDVGMRLKRITDEEHQYLESEYPSYERGYNAGWTELKSQEEREQTYMYEVWMGKQPDERTDEWVDMNRRRLAFKRMMRAGHEIPGTLKKVNYRWAVGMDGEMETMKQWNEIADALVKGYEDDSVPAEVVKHLEAELKAIEDEVRSTIEKAWLDARRKYGVAPPRWLTAESLQSMIFEELAAVGAASPQGQQGVKSKKDKAVCGCGCPKCTQPGADAFAYEILVSGDEDKFEGS